jgi:sugar phosphate isomerase/epimerase
MKLKHGLHLAYCTNIHRGESWAQTLDSLERYTLPVRERVCPNAPYAIGLRLGQQAARELAEPASFSRFQRWLDVYNCYVFTINGFPYGAFHGTRVKEQVYSPDWTSRERVEYTKLLFELLAKLVPDRCGGSVSTVPCSYKEFITAPEQVAVMVAHLWELVDFLGDLSERTNRDLHLGLEPEPLCYLETSGEAVEFFERMRAVRRDHSSLERHLGVNYDNCHQAVEFEEPRDVIRRFREHRIRVSKLHFSSALKVRPTPEARAALRAFADDIYFHQVIARRADGSLRRFRDLDVALDAADRREGDIGEEWRIHFHIPLHSQPTRVFETTADHIDGVMDLLAQDPALCSHIEMETYTWEVLPPELKNRDVVEQLVDEYKWTLSHLEARGLGPVI